VGRRARIEESLQDERGSRSINADTAAGDGWQLMRVVGGKSFIPKGDRH